MLCYRIARLATPLVSVLDFVPLHFRCIDYKLVSCYTFLRWWPLLSLHPNRSSVKTSFNTWSRFKDLNPRSGLFPSPLWTLSLIVCVLSTPTSVFEVWLDLMQLMLPIAIQSSTPDAVRLTLYLNRFRREPAISEFDWSFTPNHRSSQRFATRTGSILRSVQLIFNLSMVRSLGFGFNATNVINIKFISCPLWTCFRFASV